MNASPPATSPTRLVASMVAPGHSFGLVCLDGLPLDPGVPPELHLDPTRKAMRGLPFDVDESWAVEALGSTLVERLRGSTLSLLAIEPDLGPGRHVAVREAERILHALQLVGFVRLERAPLWVAGRSTTEDPRMEAVGELRRPRVPPGAPVAPLGWVELGFALRLREGLGALAGDAPHGLVLRAVERFLEGLEASEPAERIHAFVRGLEVLVAPAGGGARKAFRRRTSLFFGKEHRDLAARLYRVKRRTGHGRGVADVYAGAGEGFQRRVALWHDAVTLEILSRGVLQRLLMTPSLWSSFEDEDAAERFWRGDRDERLRAWGREVSVPEARLAFRKGALHPDAAEL